MAGVGLGGAFAQDPNPNPFVDMLPPTGAVLDGNGQPVVDPPSITLHHFEQDEDGWDPPSGNGLGAPKYAPSQEWINRPGQLMEIPQRPVIKYGSKLDQLKIIEENIRDLLIERRILLRDLKTERDEINERLNISEDVTKALDEMFPEPEDEPEFKPESEDD